ncbi:hypothetical protein [Caulobacter sp. RHG1]|uniref:hypothetical protein n=1 Tax=Caulobacter sp. (strain RHG1) TaxID=2545762 RepID=UPI001557B910|nr:hypothetical protein [Caulobacter sp. RHG1]
MSTASDPLYARLLTISAMIEGGQAAPLTVEQWEQLAEVVTIVMDAAKDSDDASARERFVRDMIQAYADDHWPERTLH